jgi:ubiquinone/menaquinone biosynthesis C-methylase UbiE
MYKLDNPKRRTVLPPELPVQIFGFRSGAHVADFGCGSGYFGVEIARAVGSKGLLFAVDQHPEMLDAAEERFREADLKQVRFIINTENNIPLADATLDDVFMATVYHELESPETVFKEIHRVLLDGGRILVLDWLPVEEEMGPPLEYRIAPEEVIQTAETAGFARKGEIHHHGSFYLITFVKQ